MRNRLEPRRATIDGQEFVLLEPEQYERLAAARRQHGAHSSQLSRLREQLNAALRRLNAVRRVLDETVTTCETTPDCAHCAVKSALES
ncbi:hypothetical protein ACFO1B_14260 [Dactylosporangium siamense]|uniref:Uncharacterized protein n=1 Tax=Dactylosporangium siamense TaxID=685454 RepID=A0A919PMR8_9ACTN|nr:hypothetical protein [Dactylosporangium siamense]GIG44993.1 hypothetical protein Dsi01nite_030340 [Dactylosporangium siamense]